MRRHIMSKEQFKESILDAPQSSLCPEVWNISTNPPNLTDEAQHKINDIIHWAQNKYNFNNLSVYIIGSICSNSYSGNSDIDIDFCAPNAIDDDNDEDKIKEFGWKFKKDFIDNFASTNDAKVGSHPFEVYFSPSPFQCFMSIGCYNVLESKWEVGPEMKDQSFDPVSKYYAKAMKQVDFILKDIRTQIFKTYEDAFACKTSTYQKFKSKMHKQIAKQLADAFILYNKMKEVRSNFLKPCKSKEEAFKRRKDIKSHIVDAAFKFLDKFGYIAILKDFMQLHYDIEDNILNYDELDSKILHSVSSNMQLKSLQDSNDEQDKKMLQMMQEVERLDESVSDNVKISFIASLMAISSLLPANALSKTLAKAKSQDSHLTINSPAAKKAIADAATSNEMIGSISKANLVNLLAQVLWKEARGEGDEGIKAVASVIMNRTGNKPEYLVAVLKQPDAFSCMAGYSGGWDEASYHWFLPYKQISKNPTNKAIWDLCNNIALQVVDKKFTSTVGNFNAYLNKSKASQKALNSWGKQCNKKIGSHHFGYLRDRDPKYVVPGTYTSWKQHKASQKASERFVIVKANDTLSRIAKDNNLTLAKLLDLNKDISNPNAINIGQKIRVA